MPLGSQKPCPQTPFSPPFPYPETIAAPELALKTHNQLKLIKNHSIWTAAERKKAAILPATFLVLCNDETWKRGKPTTIGSRWQPCAALIDQSFTSPTREGRVARGKYSVASFDDARLNLGEGGTNWIVIREGSSVASEAGRQRVQHLVGKGQKSSLKGREGRPNKNAYFIRRVSARGIGNRNLPWAKTMSKSCGPVGGTWPHECWMKLERGGAGG